MAWDPSEHRPDEPTARKSIPHSSPHIYHRERLPARRSRLQWTWVSVLTVIVVVVLVLLSIFVYGVLQVLFDYYQAP
jgi:hypothetical protein